MRVTRFHHVSVNCSNTPLTEMVSFYDGLFGAGLEGTPRHPRHPGSLVRRFRSRTPPRWRSAQGTAIDSTGNHFCVAVEDLAKAIAELEDRNIPYERAVQGPGTVQISINDPAGNTIELQQDRTFRHEV